MHNETAQNSSLLSQALGSEGPWLAGILNITPDSFSDGGLFQNPADALAQAQALRGAGAVILDIGGESTGPGQNPISAEEEIRRISPILRESVEISFISVDTYKSQTASFALEQGAQMINDVSALRADREMHQVIREHDAFVVLMYSKESSSHPHATSTPKEYEDLISEICSFLQARIDYALSHGINENKIIVDPGMGGFLSPNPSYSWQLLAGLSQIKEALPGFPLMIGTSRKGFLGGDISERDAASQLTGLAAYLQGADIIRTHNVSMAREFLDIWQRIMANAKNSPSARL